MVLLKEMRPDTCSLHVMTSVNSKDTVTVGGLAVAHQTFAEYVQVTSFFVLPMALFFRCAFFPSDLPFCSLLFVDLLTCTRTCLNKRNYMTVSYTSRSTKEPGIAFIAAKFDGIMGECGGVWRRTGLQPASPIAVWYCMTSLTTGVDDVVPWVCRPWLPRDLCRRRHSSHAERASTRPACCTGVCLLPEP